MSQVFNLPPEEIGPRASRSTIKEWDSIKHMSLMLGLEDEFETEFSDSEIAGIDSMEALAEALHTKLA